MPSPLSPSVPPHRHRLPATALALALSAVVLAAIAPSASPGRQGRAAPVRQGGGPGEAYVLGDTWLLPEAPAWPIDVALGAGGDVYVADGRRNAVMVFDGGGNARGVWRHTAEQEVYVPRAVAVDAGRDLVYVLWERYRGEIGQAAVPTGLFLDTRQADGTPTRPLAALVFLSSATDMAVQASTGHLFISGDGKVHRVRPGPQRIGSLDVGDTRGAGGRIAVAPDGRVAVVRPAAGNVAVFSEDGAPAGTLALAGYAPLAVAADGDGNMHVLARGGAAEDPGARLVLTFDVAGQLVGSRSVASLGAPPVPGVDWPWALALAADGMALVTGAERFVVLWYDGAGAARGRLVGAPVRGAFEPVIEAPGGRAPLALAPVPDGGLVALDGREANVVRFSADGAARLVATAPDDALDVAVGPEGAFYVTSGAGKVLRLAGGGAPGWEAACECDLGGRISAGPGVVYVSRPREHTVATFNAADGLRLRGFRLAGGVGLWPSDVVVAGDGALFTGDLVTAQVQGWRRPEAPDVIWQAGLLSGPRRLAAGRIGGTAVVAAVMADGFVEIHAAADGNLLARWRPVLPDGSGFELADIALGANSEIYLADAGARAVRVFAPGAGVPPTPVAEPSTTPTPSSLACAVRGDKWAAPSTVVLGASTGVTLTLAARCPSSTRVIGADIVLIMDRSGSMAGAKLAAAQGAARSFAELLDVRYHRLGLVSFGDGATVDVPLTDRVSAVMDGLGRLSPAGGTNLAAALDGAWRHLLGFGRGEALPVMVLLTDGNHTDPTTDPVAVAVAARNGGAQIYGIGLGEDVRADLLEAITGDAGRYFYAPGPSELYPIYSQILRLVLASLAGNLIVDDELAAEMRLVEGSVDPAGLVGGGHVRWGRSLLPASGVTFTYRVVPQLPGCMPVNQRAVADYTDADGVNRRFVFPVPTVCVVTPSPTPTSSPTPTMTPTPVPRPVFLPFAAKCLTARPHVDVVLLIDTSDSMAGDKLAQAKAAAAAFVGRLDLPRDQAGVVGFSNATRLATGLTGDRARLEAAIAGLVNSPGTRIDSALAAGLREVMGPRRKAVNRPVIILLSDGAHGGADEDVLRQAAAARAQAVTLYAIGLGADADRELLERIAGRERTYFAPDGRDLEAIYREIAAVEACR